MSKRFLSRSVAVVAVALALTCFGNTANAQQPPEGARAFVNGGGRAVVTNDEGFLPPGVVTEFAVQAWIDDPIVGDAGRFTCIVEQGGGGFTADITDAEVLGEGCILLTGTSTCVFPGIGVFFDEPVTIVVCHGGPGEGGFLVCFDNFPEAGCDAETVISGQIYVQINE